MKTTNLSKDPNFTSKYNKTSKGCITLIQKQQISKTELTLFENQELKP